MASLKAAEGGRSVASESILLVEDQDAVRQFTAAVLTGLGYRVKTVNCGEEALQIARQGVPIDLMITDVVMKGMSGPELAAHLEKIRPGTRVLYVSGYAENVAVRRGAPGATFQYLSKPFSPEDLAAKVREVMG
jgi:CheY-like chemotaxis protein